MSHAFDIKNSKIKRICPAGSRLMVTSQNYPVLHNMAMATITLKKGGLREPHWHPNANELTYCVQGKALVTMFSPGNVRDTFTLSAGEVVYIPKGYLHHLENIHSGETKFILGYDHGSPQDLNLSSSLESMSAHVLASTFGVKKEDFEKIKKHAKDIFISKRKSIAKFKAISNLNPHKLNLERIRPQIKTKGGVARIANKKSLAMLDSLALFSLKIVNKGIREPHWHPNATEINYVVNGEAGITIFSPGEKKDFFVLKQGQGSIIPTGYFHSIENIGKGELHMTIFFNHSTPEDIGLSGSLGTYSKEVLSSLFFGNPNFFETLPKFLQDRMIVPGGG